MISPRNESFLNIAAAREISRAMALAGLTAWTLASTACGYFTDTRGTVQTTGAGGTYSKAQLSYDYVRSQVLQPRCENCHGGPHPDDSLALDSFDAVKAHLNQISKTVFVDHSMPKSGRLTSEQEALLSSWINSGAPLGDASGAPAPSPTPIVKIEPTFEAIRQNVFIARNCNDCHGATSKSKASKVPLDTIRDLLDSEKKLVVPGNPDASLLVIAIEKTDKGRMPPVRTGPALNKEQIAAIREWIANGAKD